MLWCAAQIPLWEWRSYSHSFWEYYYKTAFSCVALWRMPGLKNLRSCLAWDHASFQGGRLKPVNGPHRDLKVHPLHINLGQLQNYLSCRIPHGIGLKAFTGPISELNPYFVSSPASFSYFLQLLIPRACPNEYLACQSASQSLLPGKPICHNEPSQIHLRGFVVIMV